jgi:hypothetical protein
MFLEEKAQGALEYLMMIGAAILVVAIVLIALSGVVLESKTNADSNDYNDGMSELRKLL